MTVDAAQATGDDALALAQPTQLRLRQAMRHNSLRSGVVLVAVIVLLVLCAPLLTSASPTLQHPAQTFLPPSFAHLMGTDSFGRDMFSRVLYGGRYTLGASIAVVLIG